MTRGGTRSPPSTRKGCTSIRQSFAVCSIAKEAGFTVCLAGCIALSVMARVESRFYKACILLMGCPKTVKISHSQACIDLQLTATAH